MRGGTLLIFGLGVKCQGQLWHSVYKTLCSNLCIRSCGHDTVFAQSLSNFTPREDAGGLSREYVLRIPSVS